MERLTTPVALLLTCSSAQAAVVAYRVQVRVLEARIREMHDVLGGADTVFALQARIKSQQARLEDLQAQARQVEETLEMQEFGFYRPHFDFDSSSRYQQMLDEVCDRQTAMVKAEAAVR
ncbi:MAG TPA: hypothetical protein VGN72_18195 [Tepidisphaeraceae bacterium]|jgi:hypothetical protein|nr:hypothetical protein [Tepidisphaeraceae bacterium]